ncbi:hypothetical protein F5890DRAFT_475444 [Lentinula detonsa]|uniref:F-box domain-containing protein n=1 Tax=Lentinula detonsa TaxID=2804962 RepID=A0AA38PUI5_9AGAR|nr:hypothetical protein F5890DRAFT_475444 [Lentinula detonsa]
MAFLNRRTTAYSSSSSGHFANSNTSLSITPSTPTYTSNTGLYSSQRSQSHSNSIMKRVSTMFTPKKKPPQDKSTNASLGVGHEALSLSRKKDKLSKSHGGSGRSLRDSSDSDLEDLEEIRQPNDLGPPASSIYSTVPKEESEENPTFSTPKKPLPEQQQKRLRRFSIQSVQSLLSASAPTQHSQSTSSLKRRSISYSIQSSLHSKSASLRSESYTHSLQSLSQSLLEEEAELIEGPKFQTATKVTKVSAVWAGPTRTSSVPNLGSFIPATPPPFTLSIRRKPPPRLGLRELPVEILVHVFELLPRSFVLGLAPLSKNFFQAAQMVIYGTLDLRNVSSLRQEELNTLLAGRKDLTEITQELICDQSSYPSGFPSALVLAHMTHLTTLTLPCFSIDLMQHHTAFGLRSVTFLDVDLKPTEKVELFTWLDGQVNITTLNLPRLFDPPPPADSNLESESEFSRSPVFLSTPSPSHISSHFPSPPSTFNSLFVSPQPSSTLAPPPFQIPLPPSPGPTTPLNSNFSSELASLCASSTLLPYLEVVRAPPSILQLLAPSRARTLIKVGININDTLVGGLRPAELVGFLKPSLGQSVSYDESGEAKTGEDDGGLEELCFNFGKDVDRRTVEKVLGATGAVLGGFALSKTPEADRGSAREERDDVVVKASTTMESKQEDYRSPGLQSLEIAIPWNGPRTEEMLYKTIHSILPRYRALYTLVMFLSSSSVPEQPSLSEPHSSTINIEDSSRGMTVPLPAVQVNGQLNADQTLREDAKSDENDALLSPTDTNENSVESEGGRFSQRQSYASSSQLSLASGGTAPSAGSIVSLTMFPDPPSSITPIARSSTPTNNGMETTLDSDMWSEPSSNQTSESPTHSFPTMPSSTGKSRTLLDRLPSLKKGGKRAETDPLPPLPQITTRFTPSGRSTTLPIPIPISPSSPRTPTITRSNSPSTVIQPTIPNTPTTPRMPSTPSTPRYSQSAQTQARTAATISDRFDDDLPSQRWENRRISSMTTSALSLSSSMRGVDWNHGNGGNGSGSSEPSSPRTPVPDTPTMTLTESEKKHVRMWIRQCPTLRKVVFISGAEWGS